MITQIGAALFFLGPLFLIAGLIYYLFLRRQRSRYKHKALATISNCRRYTLQKGADAKICYALVFDFVADNKPYSVRLDICRERRTHSETWEPFSQGEQVVIYYNPKNPKDIDVEMNSSRKVVAILTRAFIYVGLISSLLGYYLTFHYE